MKLKPIFTMFMALGLMMLLTWSASGAGQSSLRILVDGRPLDASQAYISGQGVTMIPLRAVAEALGCDVAWDAVTQTVSITSAQGAVRPAQGSALVVLDPGHGGEADGANYGGVKEKDLNLSIAAQTAKLLEEAGVTVLMTRTDDRDVDLYARTGLANDNNAALFVSIHCNANVDYDDAMGIYTCAYSRESAGWELAGILHQSVRGATGAADAGMEERPNLAVLRTSRMPAALVECGFMSTAEELALLVQPAYQAKLARGIADGILAYLAR